MNKIYFLLLLTFCFLSHLNAKIIPESSAKLVAANFLNNQFKKQESVQLELSYTSTKNSGSGANITPCFYVFNVLNGDGFVMVSADDNIEPILGYSTEKDFDDNNIPSNVENWLKQSNEQIAIVIEQKLTSTVANAKWHNLLTNQISAEKVSPTAVKPLLQTIWNQNPYYNDMCPLDNNVRTVTGCVATAMAQAMKYWNYPTTGTGSRSYTAGNYGVQSVNFGTTTYNWANMPNAISSANSDIAKLMYHCGVAIEMNYGTAANGGSGAYVDGSAPSAEHALKTYFGYSTSLQFKNKSSYATDALWLNVIKNELIAARVVIYQGFASDNSSGHCFVADGFDVNNFIHFNWGWGGSYDGYFSVASLIPSGSGTGGGAGNYTSNQGALIGLKPPTSVKPTVDFSASQTFTTVGSTVTLLDASTNIPNSWTWTITPSTFTYVNGTSDNSKFPEVKFSSPGVYTVKLDAVNSIGTGTLTKTSYITVNPALTSQVCDTLTNFSSTDQIVNYRITGGGYMVGHNVSKLKAYAEYYSSYTPYTHVSGVILDFAHAEASNSTNTISVNLYSNSAGKPGTILATKTVKLIDIVNDVNNNRSTTVLFDTPYQLTGAFYVGYSLTYAAGDTVSVYSGESGKISTNTAFLLSASSNWCAWNTCWTNNQHLKISPLVSTMPTANFTITSSPATVNTSVNIDASSSVGAYGFNWTIPNASKTSSKFYQETISYATPGTYNITLEVTGGCGTTKQIIKEIIVNDNCTTAPSTPGTISGYIDICPGQTNITYSIAAVSGAASYTWILPTGFTGSSTTNTITVNATTAFQGGDIKVKALNLCGESATTSISISPMPKITPNFNAVNSVCAGSSIVGLPTQSTNGINGSWSPALNNTTTTTYTFTPTAGQCANNANLTITILPKPIVTATATATTITQGQSVTLTGNGAVSYTWNYNVTNGVSFSPTTTKTYTVTGKDANNCSNTATILITVNASPSVGIEHLNLENSIKAYFESSTNQIFVVVNNEHQQNVTITVFNGSGQQVYSEKSILYKGENTSTINTSRFSTGIYLLKLENEKESILRKIYVY